MAALTAFDATKVAPTASVSDCVPAGEYVAMITESSMAVTKSGGEMLKLTVTILEGQHQNRKVWANLNLIHANPTVVEIAQRELSAICHAVGVLNLNDSAQLHNKPLVIKTAVKTDPQYVDRAEVKAWKAVSPLSKPTPAVSPAPNSGSASSAPAWKPATQASQPSQPVGGAVKPHEDDAVPF